MTLGILDSITIFIFKMPTNNLTINSAKKRSTKDKFRIYHKINIRNGLYNFLGQNFVKLILVLAALILAIFLLDLILDLKHQQELIQKFVHQLRPIYVFLMFLGTESILGLIPPDIFIFWSKARFPEHPYLIVTMLAGISYIGGINAYYLGRLIRKSSAIKKFVQRKYEKNFNLIEKWGGLVIVMAALFPLPFAMTSTVAGIVNYPVKSYLLYGLTRFIRFFLYAVVIFGALKEYL